MYADFLLSLKAGETAFYIVKYFAACISRCSCFVGWGKKKAGLCAGHAIKAIE